MGICTPGLYELLQFAMLTLVQRFAGQIDRMNLLTQMSLKTE